LTDWKFALVKFDQQITVLKRAFPRRNTNGRVASENFVRLLYHIPLVSSDRLVNCSTPNSGDVGARNAEQAANAKAADIQLSRICKKSMLLGGLSPIILTKTQ